MKSLFHENQVSADFDTLVPEGHHKNQLRQQFLRKIKTNLVKNLSDHTNAIAKGQTQVQIAQD